MAGQRFINPRGSEMAEANGRPARVLRDLSLWAFQPLEALSNRNELVLRLPCRFLRLTRRTGVATIGIGGSRNFYRQCVVRWSPRVDVPGEPDRVASAR